MPRKVSHLQQFAIKFRSIGLKESLKLISSRLLSRELNTSLNFLYTDQIELIDQILGDYEAELFSVTLGQIYCDLKDLYDSNARNKSGSFFTPILLVDQMLSDFKSSQNYRTVLDPACGSGVFLERALKHGWLPSNLYGVELDPIALELTSVALKCATKSEHEQVNLVLGNFLLQPSDFGAFEQHNMRALMALDIKSAFAEVFEQGGFDLIIGNPPYGLSRDQQIGPDENAKLKETFKHVLNGKVNKYLLFMSRSYELLKDNASLCFVVPNAWLGIKSAEKLRETWLKQSALRSVRTLDKNTFPELSVETVVFIADKAKINTEIRIKKGQQIRNSSSDECLKRPGFTISLVSPDQELDQALKSCKPLSSFGFIARIALQAYAIGAGKPAQSTQDIKARIYNRKEYEGPNCIAYLEGKDIGRYQVTWSGNYLLWGPWLAEPQKLEFFQGERIAIREITSKLTANMPYLLQACFLDQPYLYNKSVLHILPGVARSKKESLALLAILNSQTASRILLQRGRKVQRTLFPKLVAADLKDFPLPSNFLSSCSILADLALARMQIDCDQIELDRSIDQAVLKLYDLYPAITGFALCS